MSLRVLVRCAAAGALAALAAAPSFGQHPGDRDDQLEERVGSAEPDPWAGEDRALREALGIVSYGPFEWADHHGTSKIQEVLGDVTIRWVETAHFRIGSALGSYRIPQADKAQRAKLRAELEELEEVLPEVDPKTKVLDPWLRVHLFARRLEQQYADIQGLLGVTDTDFPREPTRNPTSQIVPDYHGEGPYLGMPAKFTVLLLEKQSDLGRYTLRFLGAQKDTTTRHLFHEVFERSNLFLGVATEAHERFYADDTRLHCHVAFSMTHNLVHAYKYYWHTLPCWVAEGLAHWYARGVFEENNNWSGIYETSSGLRNEWNWVPKIYARVKEDYFPGAAELMAKTDYSQLRFAEHMMIWSRVEYLLTQEDPARFARFLDFLSDRIPEVQPGSLPTPEQVLVHQQRAWEAAYELPPEEFDRRWKAWVLKEFKKRKR